MNEERKIYGYDSFHHEKYCCSVDYFIDNYKDFAKDDLTFRIFHSKEARDEYATECVRDDSVDHLDLMLETYMDSMKEKNLDAEWTRPDDEVLS